MITVRDYNPSTDYLWVEKLYRDSSTYGGQYDDARHSRQTWGIGCYGYAQDIGSRDSRAYSGYDYVVWRWKSGTAL